MDSGPKLSLAKLVEVLEIYGVQYLVVGGVAARAHGASRVTEDFDCVVQRSDQNLDRVASALRAMNARLRVEGMTDEEAKQLPVVIDTHMLKSARLTTWQTDFGPLDVLAGLESQKVPFKDFEFLETNASTIQGDGFLLRTAALTDIIEAKEFANRPKDQEALPELRRLRDAT